MLVYALYFVLAAGLGAILGRAKATRGQKMAYAGILLLYLFALSALRYNIGSDYFSYARIFDLVQARPQGGGVLAQLRDLNALHVQLHVELSFLLICRACALLGGSIQTVYAVVAAGCLAPVFVFIVRESPMPWLSAVLYMALFCFASSIDFVRQNLALGITLLGYPLLKKRGWRAGVGYVAVILCAAVFHATALLMLGVYAVSRVKIRGWVLLLYGALGLVLVLFSADILDWVIRVAAPRIPLLERFESYAGDVHLRGMQIYVAWFPLFSLALLLAALPQVRRMYPADADVLCHLAVWTGLFWLLAGNHQILGRFTIYTVPYAMLSLPVVIRAGSCGAGEWLAAREAGKGTAGAVPLESAEAYRRVMAGWLTGFVVVLALVYFAFGSQVDRNDRGHRGMYMTFPYESVVPWVNRLP